MGMSVSTIVAIIGVILILKICKKIISKVIGIVIILGALAYAAVQFGLIQI
jgi:hypothetical protein